jgi:hypothetical protein
MSYPYATLFPNRIARFSKYRQIARSPDRQIASERETTNAMQPKRIGSWLQSGPALSFLVDHA